MTEDIKEESNESLSDVGGKEVTLELKGKEYTLAVLSLGDMKDFENSIRSRRLKEFRDATYGMDESVRMEGIASIVRSTVSLFDVQMEINAMSGVVFILHRSLLPNYPDMTIEQVERMVDLDNFQEVSTIISNLGQRASRPPPPEPQEEGSPEE